MAGGKKKKTRNLILLLLLLVVAAGAYAAVTLWPEEPEEQTEVATDDGTVLVEMEDDAVVKLEYKGQNSDMALVLEEGIWYRDDDREFPVNQTYAGNMVSLIAGLTSAQTINETPESLGDYGLEDPKVWVRISDAEGNSEEVRVGIKSPGGDGCYVAVNDSQVVYLASTSLLSQFQYSETQMIAKHSTPSITAENITRILIEKPEGNLELSLEPGNELDTTGYNPWLMRQGFDVVLPGDSDSISNELVQNYTSFTLGDCVAYSCDDPAQYGLEEPTAVLSLIYYETVDTGEVDEDTGEAVTKTQYNSFGMKVGDNNGSGNYYVQLDGTDAVYLMSETAVDNMINVEAYDYVAKLPGLVNISQVDKITIEYGAARHEMTLERVMETTTDSEGNEEEEEVIHYFLGDREVEKSEFTTPYQKMIGIKIDGLADEAVVEQASEEPVLTLTYDRTNAGLKPVVVHFYPYNDNFNRISVDGISFFRVNIRDVESLTSMFDEVFAE